MEISSVESEDLLTPYQKEEPKTWEKLGKIIALASSLIGFCAAAPTLFQKKKVYPVHTPSLNLEEIVDLGSEEAPPPPVPLGKTEWREAVQTIISIAGKGFFEVLSNAMKMKRLGDGIEEMHPFSFLLAPDPAMMRQVFLKGCLPAQSGVMGGIVRGLEREYKNKNLEKYIPSFAEKIKKDPAQISHLIRDKNWKQLVDYLFDINRS